MHKAHRTILAELKSLSGTANRDQSTHGYTGSTHLFYAVPVPKRRLIIRTVARSLPESEILSLTESLFGGSSHEEKTMGAMLLKYRPSVRREVSFTRLEEWLGELVGWAEVDSLCFNIYTAEELLHDWERWERLLRTLAQDKNINKRRAALVFLTGPTARSGDGRLHELAFLLAKELSREKEILITKAISWLLRSQCDTNKADVRDFLEEYENHLPKIALRETRRKLEIGKKNK